MHITVDPWASQNPLPLPFLPLPNPAKILNQISPDCDVAPCNSKVLNGSFPGQSWIPNATALSAQSGIILADTTVTSFEAPSFSGQEMTRT